MDDRAQTREAFLKEWTARRIVALGGVVDPSDREYLVRERAKELTNEAREKGLLLALDDAVKPYRGIEGYVRYKYERAEAETKEANRRK